MAISPSHKFGQIIGDVVQAAVLPLLQEFAKRHGLYLDGRGRRPARKGVKCSWTDLNGNTHDLDYVVERGGTDYEIGTPVAFIETAWRRYTKHSRNKAQEIQGAIEPLAQTYYHASPFKAAVLAGVFTEGALNQMRSLGFTVLFFPYSSIVTAFQSVGIDGFFDEDTPDAECQQKVEQWQDLSPSHRSKVPTALLEINQGDVKRFMSSLTAAVSSRIERVVVLPLYGNRNEVATVEDAVRLIESYDESQSPATFQRYEIQIWFTNGNEINGKFNDKVTTIEFLHRCRF